MKCDECSKEIGMYDERFLEDEMIRCESCYMKSLGYYECNCGEFFKHDIITHACQECWDWEDTIYNDLCRNGKVGRYDYGYEHERQVRDACSALNRQGHINYPKFPNTYVLFKESDMEDLEKHLLKNIKQIKAHYFNKIKPYRQAVKNEKLKKLMGGLDDLFSTD